jgi:arylsulfatase A-like enzyme
MWEGGVRVPCVVSWPGITAAGTSSDEIIQASDFYPTFIQALSLNLEEGQKFDSISILPALKGGKLDREGIFTYFPHNPPVPEWLPPSVSVHSGDWKLIRIFHGGENGAHRYKLMNLAEDIGEKNNLADEQPERVQQLDALIEDFLKRTNAVVPIANPAFDPTKYDASKEGIRNMPANKKPGANKKPAPKKKPVPKK